MATWKILGQDASTSTGSTSRRVAYTNATTNGVVAWALMHNRTTGAITVDLFVSTSTGVPNKSHIYGDAISGKDTYPTSRFTLSTGDSVIWRQATTGISISVFGAEGISTA